MSASDSKVYATYHALVKNSMFLVGFWPGEKTNILYSLVPYMHMAFCAYSLFGVYGFFMKFYGNVMVMTSVLGLMVGVSTVFMKAASLVVANKDVAYLREYLNSYFNEFTKEKVLKTILLEEVVIFYRFALNCVLSVAILCTAYATGPLIYIIVQYCKHPQKIKYLLPYPSVFPWEIPPNSLNFWLHYFVESCTIFSTYCVNACVDSSYTFQLFQIIGLIRGITYRLKNLNLQDNYEITLRQCISQYEDILKFHQTVQRAYGPIILMITTSNAVVMCALIFQVTHAKTISVGRVMMFAVYVFVKLSQTFVYAWIGTRLTTETEKYLNTICEINWVGHKKLLSVFLVMLPQKSLEIVACKITIVSVNIFVKVVNTTVSYFFLLKTLEGN